MPYPAQGLYPSSLLYPLEAGVEFVNFTKDFKRLVNRYGRSLKNDRTNSSFRAILNILSGAKCIGDDRTMKCGDAIAYVLPSLSYEIGDHIIPISGRGEWVIVTERYASRVGDLSIFRALGLERYTPGATLKGVYTVVEPATVGVNFTGVYALTEDLVRLEMLSRYDINALEVPGIMLAGIYNLTEDLVRLEMLSRYDINALEVSGIMLAGIYNLAEDLVRLEMLSRYDINALEVSGIMLASKYDLTEVFVPLDMISSYTIIAYDSLYPSTPLYPSTTLYPRGTGRIHEIMGIEFTSKYDIYIRVLFS